MQTPIDTSRKKKKNLIVLLIIISQLACVFFVSSRKQEFNIDEIYSYILSNSFHADKLSNADDLWGRWADTEALSKYITVQRGERLAFGTVYKNNSTDCHPPVYYWLLHALCSLTPDVFSKWSGLSLNILSLIVSLIFIYKITLILLGDSKLVYLPVLLYGFSPIAFETVTFIRMYMLLTMFAVILMYIHLGMFRFGITKHRMAAVWVILYLGSMTHYYFVVLGFWAIILFAIRNIREARKEVIKYAAGSLAAEALFVITYPYVIIQAMGSETNNVGNEIMSNMFNWRLWIRQTAYLLKSQEEVLSYSSIVSAVIAALIICITALVLARHVRNCSSEASPDVKDPNSCERRFYVWLAAVYCCTFLSITFIGGEYVFLRYIYYIGPALYILISFIIERFCSIKPGALSCALLLSVIFAVLNAGYGILTDASPYLYRNEYKKDMLLETYHDESLIMMTSRNPAVPTGNLTKMQLFKRIYMSDDADVLGKNIAGGCLKENGECIIYINTDTYYTDGYDAAAVIDTIISDNSEMILKAERLCEGSLGEYYLLSTQTTS